MPRPSRNASDAWALVATISAMARAGAVTTPPTRAVSFGARAPKDRTRRRSACKYQLFGGRATAWTQKIGSKINVLRVDAQNGILSRR